jgi:hypothetical protein
MKEPFMSYPQHLLTVIIPMCSEAPTIAATLDAVSSAPFSKQVIVVDDGSIDGSARTVEDWMREPGAACTVRLCRHPENRGKGAAIRTGLAHAEGQIAIVQDADLECDPADYPALIEPIVNGSADVVFGSRFLASGVPHPWNAGRIFVCIANALVRILYGKRISDEAGCYKVMRTQCLRDLELRCTRFEFCPEVVAKVCLMGLATCEVPVRYHPRSRREGKKIGWRDAAQALFTLCWWRFARLTTAGPTTRGQVPPCGRSWQRAFVASILAGHVLLLLGSLHSNFITYDEIVHVPAGLSHWQTGSFNLDRVNPPLGRMLATLPLLLADAKSDYSRLSDIPGHRRDWEVGQSFMTLNGERTYDLIRLARLSGIAWSLLGAWLIYRWTRELYGDAGGCLALVLWCFDPNILAHAPLATPDLSATVAGLAAVYAFWKYLQGPGWAGAIMAGLALGVAQLTKQTLILLYGILPVWWLLNRLRRTGPGIGRTLIDAAIVVSVSLYVLNAGYAFKDTCWRLKDYTFASRMFRAPGPATDLRSFGNRFRGTWIGGLRIPLPADYVRGIDLQRTDFEAKLPSYLNGCWQDHGWWYYYLEALAIKEPLGFLLLATWGLGRKLLRRAGAARDTEELGLLASALVYFVAVSSQTGFNHHMRYVMPMLPFLIVGTGTLGYLFRRGHIRAAAAVVALTAWAVVSSLTVYPCSLSYFNEVAGGPLCGHAFLVDSNIDWGQDLLRLRDWLRSHPEAQPLHLAYFGSVEPRLFGIDYRLPPPGPMGRKGAGAIEGGPEVGPVPGYHAVSVNALRGMMFHVPSGGDASAMLLRQDRYTYFLQYRPIARAGYSIYIYHVTEAEADAARRRMGLPPLRTNRASSRTVRGDSAERATGPSAWSAHEIGVPCRRLTEGDVI